MLQMRRDAGYRRSPMPGIAICAGLLRVRGSPAKELREIGSVKALFYG